ncbi:coagulation factor precursor-like protein [Sarcoptes scabiei]|uniref:Coagulation factor-like protein n=1 Tax=Sarcoptes scabiei TaxID=52283 RepID=A0A132AKN6_SARSC|nr:coagulation factor precursor-like protein [Sarcoptes scabiei]
MVHFRFTSIFFTIVITFALVCHTRQKDVAEDLEGSNIVLLRSKIFSLIDSLLNQIQGAKPSSHTELEEIVDDPSVDYGDDKKYFDYYSNFENELIEIHTENTLGDGHCEMLNGSRGRCMATPKCLQLEPNRTAFALCEWSQHPVTGERHPLKLCCREKIKSNENVNSEFDDDEEKLSEENWSKKFAFTGFPTADGFEWSFYGLPNFAFSEHHQSSWHNGQCGQTVYGPNYRHISRERHIFELSKRALNSSISNYNYPRIVSGVSVGLGVIPWMISIYMRDQFICGGSLIDAMHVLTAAHCFAPGSNPEWFYVRYGSVVLHEGHAIPVNRIFIHPGYKAPIIYHDIAIVKLASPITFSSSVQPICLATNRMYGNNLVGLKVTVSGYGDSNFEGKQSEFLQAVDIKVIENQFCDRNYRRLAESRKKFQYGIGRTLICAGYEHGIKDACQGDSGGPLTIKIKNLHYQIGIVSFGFRCAQPQFPGIYTAVSHYLKWIRKIIDQTV